MDNRQKNNIACPECDTILTIDEEKLGKVVECPACGTESEIVNINPLKLSPLEEEK